ncbi:hypothetical protein JMUB7528_28720 [Staphylococcus aureus]
MVPVFPAKLFTFNSLIKNASSGIPSVSYTHLTLPTILLV